MTSITLPEFRSIMSQRLIREMVDMHRFASADIVIESDPYEPQGRNWMRFTAVHAGNSSTIGRGDGSGIRQFTRTGVVVVEIFVSQKNGSSKELDELMKQVGDIYEGRRIGNSIKILNVVYNEIGVAAEIPFRQGNVSIFFQWNEEK